MDEKQKVSYNKPVLTVYGPINDITRASGLGGPDAYGGSDGSI